MFSEADAPTIQYIAVRYRYLKPTINAIQITLRPISGPVPQKERDTGWFSLWCPLCQPESQKLLFTLFILLFVSPPVTFRIPHLNQIAQWVHQY